MSVPAIDTSKIGTFSWWKQSGTTEVALADCLGILHSYNQYPEYVDGTIKIFDTGSESVTPNNYNLVNVRIRSDGYILAWFNIDITSSDQTSDSGTGYVLTDANCQIQNYHDSAPRAIVVNELAGNMLEFTSGALNGNIYTIQSNTASTITLHTKYGDNSDTNLATVGTDTYKIYSSRGNLVWWGHTSSADNNPTNQSTRLGRAIYEIWEQLKGNQVGGDGAVVDYTQIRYYDYEYTDATYLYMIGNTSAPAKYYYFTIPIGRTVYNLIFNYGFALNGTSSNRNSMEFSFNNINKIVYTSTYGVNSNGFVNIHNCIQINGIQNTIYHYGGYWTPPRTNSSLIILTNG